MSFDNTTAPAFPGHTSARHFLLADKCSRVQVLNDTGDDRTELSCYDGIGPTKVLLTPGEALRLALALAVAALRGWRRA